VGVWTTLVVDRVHVVEGRLQPASEIETEIEPELELGCGLEGKDDQVEDRLKDSHLASTAAQVTCPDQAAGSAGLLLKVAVVVDNYCIPSSKSSASLMVHAGETHRPSRVSLAIASGTFEVPAVQASTSVVVHADTGGVDRRSRARLNMEEDAEKGECAGTSESEDERDERRLEQEELEQAEG
jgi:hypothetical protein